MNGIDAVYRLQKSLCLFKRLHLMFVFLLVNPPLAAQSYDFTQNVWTPITGNAPAEQKVWELVNLERAKAGLIPLSYDSSLQSAARQHSQEMLTLDYFSHASPTKGIANPADRTYRAGLTDGMVGENIALHSLDGPPDSVAARLMQQWMQSPGHRANILRPEFTHMGVGVISSKDSTVRDTLIQGRKARLVVYAIRHHGTQVFVARKISFTKLALTKKECEFLMFDLEFSYDREALASFDNYTQFFRPSDHMIRVRIAYPMRPLVSVYLARLQNEYTREYLGFFQDEIVRENLVRTLEKLSRVTVPLLNKDIRLVTRSAYFLEGEGKLISADSTEKALIHVGDDRYFEFDVARNRIEFSIPVESDGHVKKIAIAVGNGREKPVTNQLKIDTSRLNAADKKASSSEVFLK